MYLNFNRGVLMTFSIRDGHKYKTLYLMLITLMVTAPFTNGARHPLVPFLFFFVILSVLRILNLKKRIFVLFLSLAFAAFFFDSIATRIFISITEETATYFKATSYVSYVIFLSGSIYFLVIKIFLERNITTDTIKGGVAVYFLIGILGALLFGMLQLFDRQALSIPPPITFLDLLYFSFTTLSTLGYGDISPVSGAARNIAVLEAISGQLYIAILVARIVALHSTGNSDNKV